MLALLNSDRAVVRKVLAGNLEAFHVLVERYAGVIHGIAFARLQNAADADDVTQETFTRFYEQLDRMARHKHIGPWLVHVARNACTDIARKRAREPVGTPPGFCRGCPAPFEPAVKMPDPARQELCRLLYEQLQAMDVESREVLVLFYFMKKRAKEIAALLEISPEAAAKRIQRARNELGERLTDLLGDEFKEVIPGAKHDPRLETRIMAAVAATAAAWKASAAGAAAAAGAAGLATGAGLAKLAAGLTIALAVAVVGYLAYDAARPRPVAEPGRSTAAPAGEAQAEPAETAQPVAPSESFASEQPEDFETAAPETPRETAEVEYPPIYGSVTGVISMEDGSPAAGAEVWLDNQLDVDNYLRYRSETSSQDQEPVEPFRIETKTDSSGRYELAGFPLSPGDSPQYYVRARRGGFSAEGSPFAHHYDRNKELNLTLLPSGSFGGIVKGINGQPVKGAAVNLADHTGNKDVLQRNQWSYMGTDTGEDGRFLIESLPVESCRLSVSAKGYVEFTSPWLKPGATDLVFQLDAGNSISGRAVDTRTGDGVPNVQINGRGTSNSRAVGRYIGFCSDTDSSGSFTIGGIEPGTYDLTIIRKNLEPLPVTLVEPLTLTVGDRPLTGLELKMAEGATLRGRIIDDETGAPPLGRVYIHASYEDYRSGRGIECGPDGSYEIVGLPEGELVVNVYCGPSHDSTKRYTGKVALGAREVKEHHDIRLPARASVCGTVTDESGAPLPGASVCALTVPKGELAGSAVSDMSGRFQLYDDERAKPAPVFVQAFSDSGYSALSGPYRLADRKTGVALQVVRSGQLEGEVVDQSGKAAANLIVAAVPESPDALVPVNFMAELLPGVSMVSEINGGKSLNTHIGPGGAFSFTKLRPGKYTLEIHACGNAPGRPIGAAVVNVFAGRTTQARLTSDMSWFGGVEGTVLLDGKPLADQVVAVEPVDAEWLQSPYERTAADGRYMISALAPGQVVVKLEGPEFAKQQTVEIVSGEMTRADFALEGGGAAVEGQVTVNGLGSGWAYITFTPVDSADGDGRTVQPDSEGRYAVSQLAQGVYLVEARIEKLNQTIEVELVAGQTAQVDFPFKTCEINGVIAGLRNGERAYVGLFPAGVQLPEWSVEALDAFGEHMIADVEVKTNGPFSFSDISEGEYVVCAVSLPAEGEATTEAMLNGRFAASQPAIAKAGAPSEVAVVFK